jgi:hypothetical protein
MEVLAVRWLFPGKEIHIETMCLDCGKPISVRMRDEEILAIDPPTSIAYLMSPFAKWREGTGAFN